MKRRGRLLTCLGVGLPLLLCAALLGWLTLPPHRIVDVTPPPSSASPRAVAVAYMKALDAHDCVTANDLWVSEAVNGAEPWCKDLGSLGDARVTRVDLLREGSPRSPRQVVEVHVDFDVAWRAFHNDGSVPEGENQWGYLMERPSSSKSWRIFDESDGL